MQPSILLIVALGLAACGTNRNGKVEYQALESELVEEHRPALSSRLKKLQAVQAAAAKRPALAPLTLPAKPGAKLLGFGETEVLDRKREPQLERYSGCSFFFDHETLSKLNGAVGFWSAEDVSPGPDVRAKIDDAMTALEAPIHAVVCVQLAAEEPKQVRSDTFEGGSYRGECRVFEIESTKYVGGWLIEEKMFTAITNSRMALADNLKNNLQGGLDEKLRPFGKAPEVCCGWDH